MLNIDLISHKQILINLTNVYGNDCVFCFVKYKVSNISGQQYHQPRVEQALTINEVLLNDNNWLMTLESEQELALTSKVFLDKTDYHIPMLDIDNNNGFDIRSLTELIPNVSYTMFESSPEHFHVYFNTLLTEENWLKYLDNANCKLSGFIDPKWISYSRRRGHSVLRWTGNTTRHCQAPKRL
jgi:hypothetical protein